MIENEMRRAGQPSKGFKGDGYAFGKGALEEGL